VVKYIFMKRGLFIVFEGGEGAGKSVQAGLLTMVAHEGGM